MTGSVLSVPPATAVPAPNLLTQRQRAIRTHPLPLERRDVTIHVRDAADVTRTILSTRHGPIVSDVYGPTCVLLSTVEIAAAVQATLLQ